jgi:hypothetical protein
MNLETLRSWLLAKPGAVAIYPFEPQPLVVKVGGKIFALVSEDSTPLHVSLLYGAAVYPQPGARRTRRHQQADPGVSHQTGPPPGRTNISLTSAATAAAGLSASRSSNSGRWPVRTACSAYRYIAADQACWA